MSCLSCGSKKQAEFSAEMVIHFVGFKNLDKPGVWLFPAVLVCLDCGFLQSKVPAPELTSLAVGTSETDQVSEGTVDDKPSLRIELGEKLNDGWPRGC
jgi:hypothetical protein